MSDWGLPSSSKKTNDQGGGGHGWDTTTEDNGGADDWGSGNNRIDGAGGSWGSGGRGGSAGKGRPGGEGDDPDAPRPAPYKPDELNLEEETKLQVDTVGENFKRYNEQKVTCIPLNIIDPIEKFEDVIQSKLLLDNVKLLHYAEMTPIQKWAIPIINNGYDLIGCAQTGSGKTAAFLLPILQTIMKVENLNEHDPNDDAQHPYCLILSPTRELAKQIYTQAQMLSRDSIIKSCFIYGQVSMFHLKSQLQRGCHILVATLGKLKDFTQRGWIGFKNIKYIVLDEGDRLVDEGFGNDLRSIFQHESMPPKEQRQTLFFSATFKNQVQRAAKEYLKDNFVFVTVGRVGAANEDIKQEFLQVDRAEKKRELRNILKAVPESDKTIIFTQTKTAADMLAGFFNSLKLSSTSIHGDRLQSQREEAIKLFRRGDKKFLISSPVGNRGLDLPKVSLVINYDLPDSVDEYVHRIGRTGRAGHTGRAISFFDLSRDREIAPELIKILQEANQEVPDWMRGVASGAPASTGDEFGASAGGGGDDEDWGSSTATTSVPASNSNTDQPTARKVDDWDDWGDSANKQSTPTTTSYTRETTTNSDWGLGPSNAPALNNSGGRRGGGGGGWSDGLPRRQDNDRPARGRSNFPPRNSNGAPRDSWNNNRPNNDNHCNRRENSGSDWNSRDNNNGGSYNWNKKSGYKRPSDDGGYNNPKRFDSGSAANVPDIDDEWGETVPAAISDNQATAGGNETTTRTNEDTDGW